jgi:anaerobic carbon-monoxide dehydrogenase iron sulfur subunit
MLLQEVNFKGGESMKIKVIGERCVGCRLCENICVYSHDGEFGSYDARIHVSKLEPIGIDYPVVCQQCLAPACKDVCPTEALVKDSLTGAMIVKENLCTGCGKCVKACPFGSATVHSKTRKSNICDLCGGTPNCVKECPTKAISIEEDLDICKALNADAQQKRDKYVEKVTRKLVDRWEGR